jgi:hypothetical protein
VRVECCATHFLLPLPLFRALNLRCLESAVESMNSLMHPEQNHNVLALPCYRRSLHNCHFTCPRGARTESRAVRSTWFAWTIPSEERRRSRFDSRRWVAVPPSCGRVCPGAPVSQPEQGGKAPSVAGHERILQHRLCRSLGPTLTRGLRACLQPSRVSSRAAAARRSRGVRLPDLKLAHRAGAAFLVGEPPVQALGSGPSAAPGRDAALASASQPPPACRYSPSMAALGLLRLLPWLP